VLGIEPLIEQLLNLGKPVGNDGGFSTVIHS
jgi:hypothetical protein